MAGLSRDQFLDLRPFRASPAFARLWIGSTLAGLGGQLTIVAVMLHVYDLTQSTFAVSMIAVVGLIPMVAAGLYGGMLADAFDRRVVALVAASITFASTALLAILAWTQLESVWSLYALSIVNSAANSVVLATRSAIVPRLLPRQLLPAAAALQGITVGIMVMAGPALAGVLVATVGYAWTYSADVVLMTSLFLGLWTLPRIVPEGEIVRPGLESLRDGVAFLRRAANIRLQYILDITAMTFGQPLALFPAIGAVLLGGGAITTGVLTAAFAAGAFVSSLLSGRIGRYRRHGLGIERAILDRWRRTGSSRRAAHRGGPRSSRGGRGRQRQRDLPVDDDAISRTRRYPRAPPGHLHRRGRRRTPSRRALCRNPCNVHDSLVPTAPGRTADSGNRDDARAPEPRVPRVRRR
jgi:MFS family permease